VKGRELPLTIFALLGLFGCAVALDWSVDASRFLTFRVALASLGLVICATTAVACRCFKPLVVFPVVVAAVWALPWWDHSPVKPLSRFYGATYIGMTRAEVQAELDRHYGWSDRHPKPEAFSVQEGHLGYKIQPPGWDDVMVVCLYFDNDRVVYRSLHDD
jgi:hypothetical protein